jgi:hypothetical protein
MKKIMMIAALMVATLSANAQQMFIKPMVGGTLTTLTGDAEDAKMKVGLVAGAEFGYNINEMFAITAGALYSMQGCAIKDADDNIKLDYINIPVLANVNVAPGLAIKAGAQFGFLMSAKAGDVDMKNHMEKFDFSIPVGLSYEISDFVIDARYNIGLSNLVKKDYRGVFGNDAKVHNGVIMLTVGYKIPF